MCISSRDKRARAVRFGSLLTQSGDAAARSGQCAGASRWRASAYRRCSDLGSGARVTEVGRAGNPAHGRRERARDPRDARRRRGGGECLLGRRLARSDVRARARERRARRVVFIGIHAVRRARRRGEDRARGGPARDTSRLAAPRHPPRRHVRAHRSAGEPRARGIRRGRHRGDDRVPPGRPENQAAGVHPARRGRRVRVDASIALRHREDGGLCRALPRADADDRGAVTQLGRLLHRLRGPQGVHGARGCLVGQSWRRRISGTW